MLRIVRSGSGSASKHLDVACAHLQSAIVHINNEAQGHVPLQQGGDACVAEDLRLIVRALADVITLLKSKERSGETALDAIVNLPAAVQERAAMSNR
jgi:hypothetical protein